MAAVREEAERAQAEIARLSAVQAELEALRQVQAEAQQPSGESTGRLQGESAAEAAERHAAEAAAAKAQLEAELRAALLAEVRAQVEAETRVELELREKAEPPAASGAADAPSAAAVAAEVSALQDECQRQRDEAAAAAVEAKEARAGSRFVKSVLLMRLRKAQHRFAEMLDESRQEAEARTASETERSEAELRRLEQELGQARAEAQASSKTIEHLEAELASYADAGAEGGGSSAAVAEAVEAAAAAEAKLGKLQAESKAREAQAKAREAELMDDVQRRANQLAQAKQQLTVARAAREDAERRAASLAHEVTRLMTQLEDGGAPGGRTGEGGGVQLRPSGGAAGAPATEGLAALEHKRALELEKAEAEAAILRPQMQELRAALGNLLTTVAIEQPDADGRHGSGSGDGRVRLVLDSGAPTRIKCGSTEMASDGTHAGLPLAETMAAQVVHAACGRPDAAPARSGAALGAAVASGTSRFPPLGARYGATGAAADDAGGALVVDDHGDVVQLPPIGRPEPNGQGWPGGTPGGGPGSGPGAGYSGIGADGDDFGDAGVYGYGSDGFGAGSTVAAAGGPDRVGAAAGVGGGLVGVGSVGGVGSGGGSGGAGSAVLGLEAIKRWARREDSSLTELVPALQDVVEAISGSLSGVSSRTARTVRFALEQSHESSKALLGAITSLLSRDDQMRKERSDAAIAMLGTKMELIRLQRQLAAPRLTGDRELDAAVAEELMDGNGGMAQALHTLTQRMLASQEKWEAKKAAIEDARSTDFAAALESLKSVVSAAQGETQQPKLVAAPPTGEFLQRNSSVISRYLAQQKALMFGGGPATSKGPSAPPGSKLSPRSGPAPPLAPPSLGPGSSAISAVFPSPRSGARTKGGAPAAAMVAGAGEALFFPQPPTAAALGRLSIRADAISEVAVMAHAGALNTHSARQAVAKLDAVGHDHFASPLISGTDYRRRFDKFPQ